MKKFKEEIQGRNSRKKIKGENQERNSNDRFTTDLRKCHGSDDRMRRV